MSFAQENYPQELGNGKYTISEAGCFLTAFCNLAERFGESIDPVTLNEFFKDNKVYLKDADGANEDLAWGSISAKDPDIIVTSVGTGPNPSSSNAIVKFHYNSVHTGLPIDHFCLVDHIDNGQVWIVDSWDGVTKAPATYEPTYHTPIAWATYMKNVPAAPITPAPLPSGPMTAESPLYAPIVKAVHGYSNATAAVNHDSKYQGKDVEPGNNYFLFTSKYGVDNVTLISGEPGAWINPADNTITAPAPALSDSCACCNSCSGGDCYYRTRLAHDL